MQNSGPEDLLLALLKKKPEERMTVGHSASLVQIPTIGEIGVISIVRKWGHQHSAEFHFAGQRSL